MPIAQIIVAPDAVPAVLAVGPALVAQIRDDLLRYLRPAPETIQVMVQAALLEPVGCDILCIVQHRASELRSTEVRADCAKAIHDTVRAATGLSVRVRLIACDPADIAACDTTGDA